MITRRQLFGMLAAAPFAASVKPIPEGIKPAASGVMSAHEARELFCGLADVYDPPTYLTVEWDSVPGATGYSLSRWIKDEIDRVSPIETFRCQG